MSFLSALLLAMTFTGTSALSAPLLGEWAQHYEAGRSAYTAGDLSTAQQEWNAALELARANGNGTPEYRQTLQKLALLAESKQQLTEAESYARERVELLQGMKERNGVELAGARVELARLLEKSGRFNEAEDLLKGNIGIYKETFTGSDYLAEPHLELARYYQRRDQLNDALTETETAITLLDTQPPTTTTVLALEQYAEILSAAGRASEARAQREAARRLESELTSTIEKNRREIIVDEPEH